MDSMLITIKRLLGISETDEHFDIDVITNINSTLVKVQQLGIGPSTGFRITSKDEEWSDLLGDRLDLESVKTYIYLKVRLVFDPPNNSFLVESINKQIHDLELGLQLQAETE